MEKLKVFDRARGWNGYERAKTKEEKLLLLQKLVVNMVGELGEFANEVRKGIENGNYPEKELKEELIDIFNFLLKTSFALEMDLKKEFFDKLEKNKKRFPPKQKC